MKVFVQATITNEDGTLLIHTALEENVPLTDRNPEVNAQRSLARLADMVGEAHEKVQAQAQVLGLVDP